MSITEGYAHSEEEAILLQEQIGIWPVVIIADHDPNGRDPIMVNDLDELKRCTEEMFRTSKTGTVFMFDAEKMAGTTGGEHYVVLK